MKLKFNYMIPLMTKTRCLAIIALLVCFPVWLQAQKLNFDFKDAQVATVLKKISEQTKYKFVYSDALESVNTVTTAKAVDEEPLAFFKRFFPPLNIIYKVDKTQVLLSSKEIAGNQRNSAPQQSWLLEGVVKDQNNQPVVGATVFTPRKDVAMTDIDGKFSIDVYSGDLLTVSCIGYRDAEIKISTQAKVNITMLETTEQLDELVVVAYGTVKKSSLVGSVNMINDKAIESRPVTSVASVLTGSTPGLISTSSTGIPGDDPNMRIRGFGTINSSSAPIYVVDGAIFDVSLRGINPADIESISVLKDAAATAIYGSRGANGVIMITTKKGSKGKESFSVSLSQGLSTRFIQEYEQVSMQDYYQLMYEALRNSYYYNNSVNMDYATATQLAAVGGSYKGNPYSGIYEMLGKFNPFYGIDNNEIIDPKTGKVNPAATRLKWSEKDTDWFDPMSRVGSRTDLSVSASGGTDKSDYYASLNYLDDNSWMKKSFTRRFSARANLNFRPLKWLRIGSNLSGSWVNSYNQSWSGNGTNNPFFVAQIIGPIYPVYLHDQTTGAHILDENGDKIYDTGGQTIDGITYPARPTQGGNRNIVAELLADDVQYRRLTFSTRSFAEVDIWDGLKATVSANIVYSPYNGYSYSSSEIGVNAPAGSSSRTDRVNFTQTYQQLLSYAKEFGKHDINVVAGHESYQYEQKQNSLGRKEEILAGNNELTNFTTISSATSSTTELRTEGWLLRANYSFDSGRYTLEGSYRRDGTSKFYKDVRWGNFWSVGAGWNIAREKFMQKVDWVNSLKLRASYGVTGNLEGIGNYTWQDVYLMNYNNQTEAGYIQDASAANRALTWEKQSQLSVALDYSLLNGRLRGTIEWFDKKNDDLLFSVRLPYSTGVTSQTQNIGCLFNRGWEFDISADAIRKENFTWNIHLSAATVKNEITRMPSDNPEIISGTKKYAVGHGIYDYWLRQWYGVDTRDGAGLYVYDPNTLWDESTCRIMPNGDKVTTNTNKALYAYSGTSIPDVYGSLQTSFEWKGLGLMLTMTYQLGGKGWDTLHAAISNTGNFGNALAIEMLDRWQKPGDVTSIPRMDNGQNSNFNATSTRQLVSNSGLWFNSAMLYYTFPQKITKSIIGSMNSLKVHLNAENLALISARKGFNPFSTFSGVTSYQYSPSRIITLGVNLTF